MRTERRVLGGSSTMRSSACYGSWVRIQAWGVHSRTIIGVVYAERGDDIYVLALMHLRRRPGYWRTRG